MLKSFSNQFKDLKMKLDFYNENPVESLYNSVKSISSVLYDELSRGFLNINFTILYNEIVNVEKEINSNLSNLKYKKLAVRYRVDFKILADYWKSISGKNIDADKYNTLYEYTLRFFVSLSKEMVEIEKESEILKVDDEVIDNSLEVKMKNSLDNLKYKEKLEKRDEELKELFKEKTLKTYGELRSNIYDGYSKSDFVVDVSDNYNNEDIEFGKFKKELKELNKLNELSELQKSFNENIEKTKKGLGEENDR